jgi:hypothetical protein
MFLHRYEDSVFGMFSNETVFGILFEYFIRIARVHVNSKICKYDIQYPTMSRDAVPEDDINLLFGALLYKDLDQPQPGFGTLITRASKLINSAYMREDICPYRKPTDDNLDYLTHWHTCTHVIGKICIDWKAQIGEWKRTGNVTVDQCVRLIRLKLQHMYVSVQNLILHDIGHEKSSGRILKAGHTFTYPTDQTDSDDSTHSIFLYASKMLSGAIHSFCGDDLTFMMTVGNKLIMTGEKIDGISIEDDDFKKIMEIANKRHETNVHGYASRGRAESEGEARRTPERPGVGGPGGDDENLRALAGGSMEPSGVPRGAKGRFDVSEISHDSTVIDFTKEGGGEGEGDWGVSEPPRRREREGEGPVKLSVVREEVTEESDGSIGGGGVSTGEEPLKEF